MTEKKRTTQAMPNDGLKGAPDGVNSQGERNATGGSDAGAPHPNPHTGKAERERADFADGATSHGGQSVMGYHGPQQFGETEVKPGGSPNAGAKSD